MDWVPLSGYSQGVSDADRPRKLTQQEINYIAEHQPLPRSADVTAANLTREGIMQWIKETLSELELCPSAIASMIKQIVDAHNKSVIAPGSPVGITAAEAVGSSTTQMTLNTFHQSGNIKSASFGIDAMKDLIFARKNPKNESTTIYFTDSSMTFEDALNTRRYLVGSMVNDFIVSYEIKPPQDLQQYWWHDAAPQLYQKVVPDSGKVLRLYLNVPNMYKHHVSIHMLAEILEQEVPPSVVAVYGPIADGIIDIYPHPNIIATLLDREKMSIPKDLAELTYLETIVVPGMKTIRVKGISGIKSLTPVVSPVWRMVLSEKPLSQQEIARLPVSGNMTNRIWTLFYNQSIMTTTGLKPENLSALCQAAGLSVIEGDNMRMVVSLPGDAYTNNRGDRVVERDSQYYLLIKQDDVETFGSSLYRRVLEDDLVEEPLGLKLDKSVTIPLLPDDIRYVDEHRYVRMADTIPVDNGYLLPLPETVRVSNMKPSEYVSQAVAQAKRSHQNAIEKQIEEQAKLSEAERTPVAVDRGPLIKASEFVYVETEGSNLREILAVPGIDKTRTSCSNMYTIAETLGIEAARSFFIRSLNETIANSSSYVHPANVSLIAEFITSRGQPFGATYTGISRQPGGHLSLATLERAGEVFIKNAIHGKSEDARNVSASIIVGSRISVGTGYFDVAQDITEQGVTKRVINDELFTALDRDDDAQAMDYAIEGAESPDIGEFMEEMLAIQPFDDRNAEDEANLEAMFRGIENIPLPEEREVEAGEIFEPISRIVGSMFDPQDFVNVMNTVKSGIPLDQPLPPVASENVFPQPIESTGLVIPQALTVSGAIPTDFLQLVQLQLPSTLPHEPSESVNVPLPSAPIPNLGNIPPLNIEQLVQLRGEQISGLEIMDDAALVQALQEES